MIAKKKPKTHVTLSLPKRSAGGYHTFKSAKDLLEEHGIREVNPAEVRDEDHFGVEIRRKYKKKANALLLSMPPDEYRNALDALGLTIAGKATARALGLGVRHCQRLATGEVTVPGPVEKLLKMYIKHGLKNEEA